MSDVWDFLGIMLCAVLWLVVMLFLVLVGTPIGWIFAIWFLFVRHA